MLGQAVTTGPHVRKGTATIVVVLVQWRIDLAANLQAISDFNVDNVKQPLMDSDGLFTSVWFHFARELKI